MPYFREEDTKDYTEDFIDSLSVLSEAEYLTHPSEVPLLEWNGIPHISLEYLCEFANNNGIADLGTALSYICETSNVSGNIGVTILDYNIIDPNYKPIVEGFMKSGVDIIGIPTYSADGAYLLDLFCEDAEAIHQVTDTVEKLKYQGMFWPRKKLAELIAWFHRKSYEINAEIKRNPDKTPWYKKILGYITRAVEWCTKRMHNLVSDDKNQIGKGVDSQNLKSNEGPDKQNDPHTGMANFVNNNTQQQQSANAAYEYDGRYDYLQEGFAKRNINRVLRVGSHAIDIPLYGIQRGWYGTKDWFAGTKYGKWWAKKVAEGEKEAARQRRETRLGKHPIADRYGRAAGKTIAWAIVNRDKDRDSSDNTWANLDIGMTLAHDVHDQNMRDKMRKAGTLKQYVKYEEEQDRKEKEEERRADERARRNMVLRGKRMDRFWSDMKNMKGEKWIEWR